ncbi:hypothetical protein D9M70_546630 [compost metagenome]
MAQAQQIDRGDNIDVVGQRGGTTGSQRTFAAEGIFQQVLSQQADQRVAAVQFG